MLEDPAPSLTSYKKHPVANKMPRKHCSAEWLSFLACMGKTNRRVSAAPASLLSKEMVVFTQPDWLPTLTTLSGNFSTMAFTEQRWMPAGRTFLCSQNHGTKRNKPSQEACCLQSPLLNSEGCERKCALGTHHVEGRQTHGAKASKRFTHRVSGHREEDTDLLFGQTVYTSGTTLLTTKIQHLLLHCTTWP